MPIYAGIDEAGYGPLFGPMVVGCTAFTCEPSDPPTPCPDLWQRLQKAVCRDRKGARGRIAVNDSKKLHSTQSRRPLEHLERAVLTFAGLAEARGAARRPADVAALLDFVGETAHRDLADMPWYRAGDDHPWQPLPAHRTEGELAVDANLLAACAAEAGVGLAGMHAAVVFEQRFNEMVAATRSKAAVNFSCVAGHLARLWVGHGHEGVLAAVDRQSGRMRYRELLSQTIPAADIRVVEESPQVSVYRLHGHATDGERRMTVRFEVEAEARHLPVALASMLSKYARELLMGRFQTWFARHLPDIAPTAGYGSDGQRFWQQVQPHLARLGIDPLCLRRQH